MDVFNISDPVMCPAQKANYGKQGAEFREMRNDQRHSPIHNSSSSEAWLIDFHSILNFLHLRIKKIRLRLLPLLKVQTYLMILPVAPTTQDVE